MSTLIFFVDALVFLVRRVSLWIARSIGFLLIAVIAMVVVEVVVRKFFGRSFGGVQEYSGYVLAILSSCGLAHTLIEKAHIRIDVGYSRLPVFMRTVLDLCAISAVNLVGWMITLRAWSVLEHSFVNSTTSTTPLSTPFWIPQTLWFFGWGWFAFTSAVLALRGVLAVLQRDHVTVQQLIGMGKDADVQEANQLRKAV